MFLLQFKILYYMYHVQGYSTCWHAIIGFIYHQVQKDIQMYCNSHTCTCIKSVWTLILIGPLIHWNIRNQEHLLVISNYFYLCQNPNLIKIRCLTGSPFLICHSVGELMEPNYRSHVNDSMCASSNENGNCEDMKVLLNCFEC